MLREAANAHIEAAAAREVKLQAEVAAAREIQRARKPWRARHARMRTT
jgi:hypothetical protein